MCHCGDIRYFASELPEPAAQQWLSPNSDAIGGTIFALRIVGTGCQLWLFILLGVL